MQFPEYTIISSSCQFQGELPVCALWTLLFISFSGIGPDEIFKMVERTAIKLGLPQTVISYDYIVIAIFEKFLNEGFATDADIAIYPPGLYLNGLGRKKCHKCGLPKA
jgi:hypothetical protein